MPYFENQGASLYYEETGAGKPLVFLHGATWDLRQWKRQAARFSAGYRVIALDARGHGRSSLPDGPVDPAVFWQDAVALLDHLNIPKAVFCGLSMGGHVSLQVAINVPKRAEGLVLIGTPCTNAFNLYERMIIPVNRFFQRIMPMRWIAWGEAAALGKSDSEAKRYIKDVVGGMNHGYYDRVWKAITSMESRAGLARIQCPVLILIGDGDWMTARQQEFMHRQIPGSQLLTIDNASHSTSFDNPEQVESAIEKFLLAAAW